LFIGVNAESADFSWRRPDEVADPARVIRLPMTTPIGSASDNPDKVKAENRTGE
jgi:hypothetical protein